MTSPEPSSKQYFTCLYVPPLPGRNKTGKYPPLGRGLSPKDKQEVMERVWVDPTRLMTLDVLIETITRLVQY